MEDNEQIVNEKTEQMITEETATVNQANTPTVCSFKERLKSKGVWISVLGALGLILNSLGIFAKWGIEADEWTLIINAVCGILVTFGILNNPTDCKHF